MGCAHVPDGAREALYTQTDRKRTNIIEFHLMVVSKCLAEEKEKMKSLFLHHGYIPLRMRNMGICNVVISDRWCTTELSKGDVS